MTMLATDDDSRDYESKALSIDHMTNIRKNTLRIIMTSLVVICVITHFLTLQDGIIIRSIFFLIFLKIVSYMVEDFT